MTPCQKEVILMGLFSEEKTIDERITSEKKKLNVLFRDMNKDSKKLYDGLIDNAAFMRVTLEDYARDIAVNGSYEKFTQSENAPPYDRERPVVRMYNTMNKNYQSIMKQLADALPTNSAAMPPGGELIKFVKAAQK